MFVEIRLGNTKSGLDMQNSDRFSRPDTSSSLSASLISRIRTFCDVASANGAPLSVRDLISVLPLDMTESDLTRAWESCRSLRESYTIADGIIAKMEGSELRLYSPGNVQRVEERANRALSNILCATKFSSLLRNEDIIALAVSGSTSYLSASENDDLDFFLVSQTDTMWISLTRSLILARAFKFVRASAPALCFSFVSDARFAEEHFAENHNALIARDAISAQVLWGQAYYSELLRSNSWIGEYYPKLYQRRVNSSPIRLQLTRFHKEIGSIKKSINIFLFLTAGWYLQLKSRLLNRKLTKSGRFSSVFSVRIGIDHCIYESSRYRALAKMYKRLDLEKDL